MLPLLVALFGCGGSDGPERYQLTGAVTYQGKPVPVGEVIFQPESGPGAVAQIQDGRYETVEEMGVVGGPHTVRIMAFDGIAAGDNSSGTPLFSQPYEIAVDLPKESGTHDFEIPATHK